MTKTPDPWTRAIDYGKRKKNQTPVVINDRRAIFLKQDNDRRYVHQPNGMDLFGAMHVQAPRRYPVRLPTPLRCIASVPGPRGRQEEEVEIAAMHFNYSANQGHPAAEDRPVWGIGYMWAHWRDASGLEMDAILQASLLCDDALAENGRPIVRWTTPPREVLIECLEVRTRELLTAAKDNPRTDLLALIDDLETARRSALNH